MGSLDPGFWLSRSLVPATPYPASELDELAEEELRVRGSCFGGDGPTFPVFVGGGIDDVCVGCVCVLLAPLVGRLAYTGSDCSSVA